MTEKIQIIGLRSISYTGTTWINFVLASHARGFYLGPPDRVWKLPPEQHPLACLLHRQNCSMWKDFLASYDSQSRFLPQLRSKIGDRIIYIANPTGKFREAELAAADIEFREIFVLRDGRSVIFSLMRHVGDRFPNFMSGMKDWLFPAMRIIYLNSKAMQNRSIAIRYEDFVADPLAELAKHRGFLLDVGYDDSALRYWGFAHHPTAGNIGTIDVLARMQGGASIDHKRQSYYDKVVEQAKQQPDKPLIDLEWLDSITREDRLAYDSLLGPVHGHFGYERDTFDEAEREACAVRHGFAELKGYPLQP